MTDFKRGTIPGEVSLDDVAKGFVYAGPSAGGPGSPGFRALLPADIPAGLPGSVSALVLLSGQSLTNVADIRDTTHITNAFDEYLIELVGVQPVTNNVNILAELTTDNGSTWQASSYEFQYYGNASFSSSAFASNQSTAATDIRIVNGVSNAATEAGVCGQFRLYNPASATLYKTLDYTYVAPINAGARFKGVGAGVWKSTTVVNGIRFRFSSGNVSLGTVRVYGIAPA